MTIKKGVDLGASFDRLKTAFKESNEVMNIEGVATAYARLFVNVEHFVNEFSDPETISDIPASLYLSPSLSKQLDDEETKEIID